MTSKKKDQQIQEYVARIDHLSERCRQCNKKLDLVVKDMNADFNIVTFHTKCYVEWFKEVREYGFRQGKRVSPLQDDDE